MFMVHRILWIFSLGLLTINALGSFAQSYPSKPIRMVASESGGGADLIARLIAQRITGPLGQPVIMDNRPTALISEIVMKAPPDGYTVTVIGQTFWISPLLGKTNYDAVTDYSPITLVSTAPYVLVVHP